MRKESVVSEKLGQETVSGRMRLTAANMFEGTGKGRSRSVDVENRGDFFQSSIGAVVRLRVG